MSVWKKCKALEIGRNRWFRIFLLIEGLLLAWGITGLFGKDAVYEYGPEDMRAYFGSYEEEKGGYFVQESEGQEGTLVDFCDIALSKGVYSVALHYETDTVMKNMCGVTDDTVGDKMLKTNGENLYASLSRTDFHMWLLQDCEHLTVHACYGGEGSLGVTGLTIRETNALNRIFLFWVTVLSLLWNGVWLFVQYDKKYRISGRDKNIYFGLGVLIVFSSIPLMLDYTLNGGDLVFHLMRIEGIKDNLLAGQFPSRIAPEWLQGYGYAAPVFYGETLLYIAALFRLTGFTVTDSYRLFFLVINIMTVLVSYHCFYRMFRDKYVGLLCAALYSLSIYRYYKIFGCGSFGEGFGVLFLPLLAWGFYATFTGDIRDKKYDRNWVPLTIGFTGLIQSHFLTGEMAGAFTILLCVILWKRVFRKKTFVVLCKTVVYSVLLSFWFMVPFGDYMLTGDFVIQHVSARTIQYRGLYPAHLLLLFPVSGGNALFAEAGMADSEPAALGGTLLAALLLWLGICFFRKQTKLPKEERGLGKISCIFALLAMLMSLQLFPWDRIQAWNSVTATLVSSLQFPNRFLSIANIALTVLAGVVAKWVTAEKGKEGFGVFCAGMTVLLIVSNGYLISNMVNTNEAVRIQNEEGMATGNISGGEYLPYGADVSRLMYREPLAQEGVRVENCRKEAHRMDVTCRNTGGTDAALDLPLLYYKGYQAHDLDTGEKLAVYPGADFTVTVTVPAGYEGTIRTVFKSPWYWRLSELVSLISLTVLCAVGIVGRKPGEDEGKKEAGAYDR